MALRFLVRGKMPVLAAMGFMLGVAGCQSGDTLGALDVRKLGGGANAAPAQDERISAEELLAYCPSVQIDDADAIFTSYQGRAQDDPTKLAFQANIADATRSCTYGGGMINMTIAAAGRIVPGPAGSVGTVNLPVRVTLYVPGQEPSSRVVDFPVSVADTIGATQFVFTDTGLSIPNPTTTSVRIHIGFEGGKTATE